jgi:acetylornithine deacetylase/succinyl-diaminopimelate desuccinylase-like protein
LKDEDLWEELKEHVHSLSSTDDWLKVNPPKFNVPVIRRWPPMRDIPKNHPGLQSLANAHKDVTGREPCFTSFKGLADSTFLSQSGIPTVLFGPGSFNNNVHGPNEFVSIEQMINFTKIYATMVLRWCG